MATNSKQSSSKIATLASSVLRDSNASALQKRIAASALSQHGTGRETGKAMEATAAKALQSGKSSETTRKLAASVTSQANKAR